MLLELWTILAAYGGALTLVGGSSPPLLVGSVADDPYVGTLDVDVVVDPLGVPEETYSSLAQRLLDRGYERGRQPFIWLRTVEVDGQPIVVQVDLLAPITTQVGAAHRHERIEGQAGARRTRGAELVRTCFVQRTIEGVLPDGRPNTVAIRVASASVIIVLKALAMADRDHLNDAYAIDYLLTHIDGGPEPVAIELLPFKDNEPVADAVAILNDKFSTIDSYGPASVAVYRRLTLGSDEADAVQALAYARVRRLLDTIQG